MPHVFTGLSGIKRVFSGGRNQAAEAVIALMGPTGSGKSTFIKTVTRREDIQIGENLTAGISFISVMIQC